jgi:hypothetical protein
MTEDDVTPEEEHAELDVQQDAGAALKTFEVCYVVTTPGVAIVRARDSREAIEKMYQGDVEQFDDGGFASQEMEVDDVQEVDE